MIKVWYFHFGSPINHKSKSSVVFHRTHRFFHVQNCSSPIKNAHHTFAMENNIFRESILPANNMQFNEKWVPELLLCEKCDRKNIFSFSCEQFFSPSNHVFARVPSLNRKYQKIAIAWNANTKKFIEPFLKWPILSDKIVLKRSKIERKEY